MPNDINPEIRPLFHIHYNWSSNTSPGHAPISVIWLAKKFSNSQETLTPQENRPAFRSPPEKIEQKKNTPEFTSNLELLAHTATTRHDGDHTDSKIRYQASSDKRLAPYHHAPPPSARDNLRRFVLKNTLARKESNITGGDNNSISPETIKTASLKKTAKTSHYSNIIERQEDTIDLLLLRVTHFFFISHINNIDALKNIREFRQRWRDKINLAFENNQFTPLPLNKEGVWRKIIHELIVSYKGMAPGLITANMMRFQEESVGIQNIVPSPEDLVQKRLEQHLQLDLQLILSGITANHRK